MKLFRLLCAVLCSMALLVSCSGDDDLTPVLGDDISVSGAQLCSGSVPSSTTSSVTLSAPSSVNSGSNLVITSTEEVGTFYVSLSGKEGYYAIPVSSTTRSTGYTYTIVITVTGSTKVTVTISAKTTSSNITPTVKVDVIPVGGADDSNDEYPETTGEAPSNVEAVDLDLPSGTLWSNMNVGAKAPEDYGYYFAWGETKGYNIGKKTFDWSSYTLCGGTYDTLTKYCTDSIYGAVDNKKMLDLTDDAAYVNWGKWWRTPSIAQLKELIDNCTWVWTTTNSVGGFLVTGPSGNSIFLPAAGELVDNTRCGKGGFGYYMSRTLGSGPRIARTLEISCFQGVSQFDTDYEDRYYGISVRPVVNK